MNLPNGYCLQNGKYRLTDVIGQGGFGITYLGIWNTEVKGQLGRVKTDVSVCIKEYFFQEYCTRNQETFSIEPNSQSGKLIFDRFKEKLIIEAKILSEVHHPYIVNVLEVFEENNTAYIAMEHIAGCSLKYMLNKQGVLPENKVLKYINQIGQALDFVHKKNILHLDIKPSNILIDTKDNARLIDFGVSKRYDLNQEDTSTAMLTLSKGFAPIEQYDNEGTQTFSPCPDIYSLGATVYNLLTDEIPVESILRATKPLVKPREINPNISKQTENVILKALKVNPESRYQTVLSMINDLDIPSYFEETQNTLIETYQTNTKKHEDETKLFTNSATNSHKLLDEERTVIRQVPGLKTSDQKKKKRKKPVLISLMLACFVLMLGAATYIWDLNNGSNNWDKSDAVASDSTGLFKAPYIPEDINSLSPEINNDGNQLNSTSNMQETQTHSNPVVEDKPSKTVSQASTDKPGTDRSVEINSSITPSNQQIDVDYAKYIEKGKANMDQKKYLEAGKDFAKAKELKMTEEVFLLEMSSKQKQEEKEITERKALYDEIMPYGAYTVVKKKNNGRYGAINNKAEETIKCVYVGLGRSKNGISFEREDNLWDIYNGQGKIIGNGLNDY